MLKYESFVEAHSLRCNTRYRISGSSLLAAMDQSSQVPHADILAVQPGSVASMNADDKEQSDGSHMNGDRESLSNNPETPHLTSDESFYRVDDRSGRLHPTVDVAEIIRRWTHALQRIHKQSLHLVSYSSRGQVDSLYLLKLAIQPFYLKV